MDLLNKINFHVENRFFHRFSLQLYISRLKKQQYTHVYEDGRHEERK